MCDYKVSSPKQVMKINLSKGFITLAGHEKKFITPEGDEMYS